MRFESKTDFLDTVDKEWEKLCRTLAKLSDAQMHLLPRERSGSMERSGDPWSPKDVLAHLHAWHLMTLGWIETGPEGSPSVPAAGYSWKTTPALNRDIYLRYKDVSLGEIQRKVRESHDATRAIIDSLGEETLLAPGAYRWAGDLPLTSYLAGSTLSHYRWAFTTIKKILKSS